MPRIPTRLDVHSEEFRQNESFNRALVEDLRREVGRAARGGSKAAIEKHRAAGKLSARERIRTLLDTGSPFLELSQLAAHGMYGGGTPPAPGGAGSRPDAPRPALHVDHHPRP